LGTKLDYIFCISTGRSGSDYLSSVFSHVEGCGAYHEAPPVTYGYTMQRYLANDERAMQVIAAQKLRRIHELKSACDVYVETNHCFIKGFGWLLLEALPQERVGVVILKRDRQKIAESYFRIGCTPLTKLGREWIMLPTAHAPLVAPPRRGPLSAKATFHLFNLLKYPFKQDRFFRRWNLPKPTTPAFIANYELDCLKWYVDETAARTEAFMRKFPKVAYYPVEIDELNTLEGVGKMLDFFGCQAKETMAEVVGTPTNQKSKRQFR